MDEYTIRQAIDLIRARRFSDARKLLRPVLEVSPTNEAAWIWFASTFSGPAEKIQAYQAGLIFCSDSEPLKRWVEKCNEEIAELRSKGEEPDPVDISEELPQNARTTTKKKEAPLALPEEGKPFEWNEPLLGKKNKVELPPEPQQEFKPQLYPLEPQPHDWMDSLRGTMDDDGSKAESAIGSGGDSQQPIDLLSKLSGQPQKSSLGEESFTQKISTIWDKLAGEEEEPAPIQKAEKPKVSFTQKLGQLWDRMGENPSTGKSEEKNKPVEVDAAPEQPFVQFGYQEPEVEEDLHPELFSHPEPEPEPVPYDEPVVVWGSQVVETAQQQHTVQPWEFSEKKTEQTAAPVVPAFSQIGSTPTDVEKSGESGIVNDPYKGPYNMAMGFGLFLIIILLVIAISSWM